MERSDADAIPTGKGRTVGPYRVEAILGVGGMGYVYRARGPQGTEVALKLIKPQIARDNVFRRRFQREVRIARTIVHPNVVPVLDHGEHEGAPYLVQRLIPDGSLEDEIKGRGVLDVARAKRVCDEVAAGLDALHEAGIVHRDVKPGNILLDRDRTAHITDFGLARDAEGTVLTQPGQAVGSLDYMAPEQIRGEQVSAATDVYALACVMFECLTGEPPFAHESGMHALWAHLQDEVRNPCAVRADLPEAVGAAVLSGLRKDAAERPQTASGFAALLGEAVRHAGAAAD